MPNINIKIRNKVAKGEYAVIVCDNSDYTAVFDFDAEWDEYTTKTARFVYGGRYTDVVFSGNECPVPVIQDTRAVTVGVFAGDLHTTTPAYFACVPSILCGNGIPADPTPDVYAQIMELLNKESGIWYPAVDDAGNMSWTRSMSETEPQPVNIKGPKGDAGADGIGIPGADGKDGVDGKSAYELAQDNGFQGTMQEWLASLVGADGANGADGKDGISPAVSVAAITGGNRVTITDAEGAKTFDVMDGAQGASGADGKDYVLTDADKQEIAETAAGLVDVPSVQPDWNQNDSTQPDYVKNRPFYTGEPVETVLVEESTVSFVNANGMYMAEFPSTFSATVGETYKVSWDGTTYECVCAVFNSGIVIGNLSIMGAGSDTGEPFIMGILNGQRIQIGTADTSASHTFSISGFVSEVVKIDEKYLPEYSVLYSDNPANWSNAKKQQMYDDFISGKLVLYMDNQDRIGVVLSTFYSSSVGLHFVFFENYYSLRSFYANAFSNPIELSESGINKLIDDYINTLRMWKLYGASASEVSVGDLLSMYVAFDSTTNKACILTNTKGDIGSTQLKSTIVTNGDADIILSSSTAGSTKKFRITVDDSGTITATEVS